MGLSKYRAVIFDLGGTLMATEPRSMVLAQARCMAAAAGVPPDEFTRVWMDTVQMHIAASLGAFRTMQAYIACACDQIGLHPADSQLDAAAAVAIDEVRRLLKVPRDGVANVLEYLKSHGFKTGLITSCGPDVPPVWSEAPFAELVDTVLFSCVEGINKGEPRIFWLAAHRLRVRPEECLYVADGYGGELANARFLGMRAVQLNVPGETEGFRNRDPWDGPVISSLTGVLELL